MYYSLENIWRRENCYFLKSSKIGNLENPTSNGYNHTYDMCVNHITCLSLIYQLHHIWMRFIFGVNMERELRIKFPQLLESRLYKGIEHGLTKKECQWTKVIALLYGKYIVRKRESFLLAWNCELQRISMGKVKNREFWMVTQLRDYKF